MPNRPPRSYEEIVRRTVPDPDSSWRPDIDVERRAREGFRAPSSRDSEDIRLAEDIHDALIAAGISPAKMSIDVDRGRVVVRGSARDYALSNKVVDVVRKVEGVGSVVNRLVIEPE